MFHSACRVLCGLPWDEPARPAASSAETGSAPGAAESGRTREAPAPDVPKAASANPMARKVKLSSVVDVAAEAE
eukprot:8189292-Alexandrium_andersonii.AAC.1